MRKETDHNLRNDLKKKLLPAICFSGMLERMEDAKIITSSGVICIDLDNVADLKAEKERLKTNPYVLSVFKSPSGNGLKVLVLHDLQDFSYHKALYYYIGNLLGVTGRSDLKFDLSCSNISHPCMWSYDSGLYLNKNANRLHIDTANLPSIPPAPKKKGKAATPVLNSNITPIQITKSIRAKALESHTLFEEYYSMYPGVRNNNLLILASFFYNDGIPEDFAVDYLIAYYSSIENGFTSDEIRKIVHSAYH